MKMLVLGAGPAGTSAALQAAELGADVTLVEAGEVGGTSLNGGPAPIRTLARAARLARDWSSWADFGLQGSRPEPDLPTVLAKSAQVARYARDKKRMAPHLRNHGVDLEEDSGPVSFADPHTAQAPDGRRWSADQIVIAIGGHAARLPVPGAELALTYNDIPSLNALPERVAIVGGADTGCQIASILADFGSAVTIFEAGPALIASADADVSAGLASAFRRRGIDVHGDTMVIRLDADDRRVNVSYQQGGGPGTAQFDAVFTAIGWPANIGSLMLEKAGVAHTTGAIPVDEYLRTNVRHIFAAGDVTGHAKLVPVARAEGRVAAQNAVGGAANRATHDLVPTGSFTNPEYGQVGLTEAAAARDHEIATGVARYEELLRPVADGRAEGFCKLIADRNSHQILGAHVLGEYSAEIIQMVTAVLAADMSVEQVAALPLAFPTFTEAVAMAAQMICRELGVGQFPQVWSGLEPGI